MLDLAVRVAQAIIVNNRRINIIHFANQTKESILDYCIIEAREAVLLRSIRFSRLWTLEHGDYPLLILLQGFFNLTYIRQNYTKKKC